MPNGVDEGGALSEVIEDFILEVGREHRVVVTIRPEGVRRQLYERDEYLLLSLQTLTPAQLARISMRKQKSNVHELVHAAAR